MDLADLDSLDFASWKNPWADLDDEAPDRDESLGRVLTLRKLLETVADYERPIEIAIETKHPTGTAAWSSAALVEMLRDFGWDQPGRPARVMSFSCTALQRVQRHAPGVPLVMLIEQGPPLADAAAGHGSTTGSSGPGIQRADRPPGSRPAPGAGAGATSTSGPSTPPASCSCASSSGCEAVITDRPAYLLERLDG